jgi:transposase
MHEQVEIGDKNEYIHPICSGIDVHKKKLFAAIHIYDKKNNQVRYITACFTTFPKGLQEMVNWHIVHGCSEICMESTGQYWHPPFDAFEKAGLHPVIAHPKYTKPLKGKKCDPADAKWIAKSYAGGHVVPSFIPPKKFRLIRSVIRYCLKIHNSITGEKNRILNCLTGEGIKLDDVFTDPFGTSSMDILEYMIQHPGEAFDVTPFIRKGCKTPIPIIQEAVEKAASIDLSALSKLRVALDRMEETVGHEMTLKEDISEKMKPYTHQLELIRTVPGFDKDPFTAERVLAEIGPDMSVFPSAKHLCSWAGVCPSHDSSARKVKGRKISRAGTYLKPLLVNIARAVVRSKKHPEITLRFNRIKNRRGYMKAIIAICKMFLTAIWHILHKDEPYKADGYMTAKKPKKTKKVITRAQLAEYLASQGITVVD